MDDLKNWLYSSYSKDNPIPTKLLKIIISSKIPDSFLEQTSFIVHKLSEIPWTTQEDLLKEINISKEDLKKLNKLIRDSEELQKIIVSQGMGRKYWNTIIPYAKSGRIQKVLNYEYDFPLRLALFPGMSCMFYCGFCGRNQEARYDQSKVMKSGAQRFKDILSAMPKNSTISIAGGLEPLTNFHLHDIVSHAKSLGHRVPLITNGYMLSRKYLKNNPGLWDLDSIRISLYGVDNDSTYFVTRNKDAFEKVRNNIIEFLQDRNEKKSNVKLGLNYIIIPENKDSLLSLIDYIKFINDNVKNGKGVDFLTIREDFGSVTEISKQDDIKKVKKRKYVLEGLLKDDQRTKLIDIFKKFQEKQKLDCPDLYIDYGYAMESLAEGHLGKPLAKVKGKDMRPSAYPQMSVTVDSAGDVFLYREAGFLDRPGNTKFIIGRINDEESLETILRKFIEKRKVADLVDDDSKFMDSYDHLLTLLVNQVERDKNFGIPVEDGPVNVRIPTNLLDVTLSNNWYRDEKS